MSSHIDKIHAFFVEKTKFDLALAKLERETRLAKINSGKSLTTPKTSGRNNKNINEISSKVFALASQFAGMPQGEILKIFQNLFWPLILYKLLHLRSHDDIYQDQIAIEDYTLQIQRVTGSFQNYANNKVIWSKVFLNYMSVIVVLFRCTFDPPITLRLVNFYRKIPNFAKVYWWQKGFYS